MQWFNSADVQVYLSGYFVTDHYSTYIYTLFNEDNSKVRFLNQN